MDGKFTSFTIDELRALVSQLEGAKEPENNELYTAVIVVLREQYDPQ